jgi:kynurenine formamidase
VYHGPEHGGTHIDAPVHFSEGRQATDEIPLRRLIGPGVVIDVQESCAADRDHLIGLDDFEAWERAHGRMPEGAIVLISTGFGAYWPDRVRYMGTAELGADAVPKLHFPGLDPEAVPWLVNERKIRAIGLDTPSIDHGQSADFAAHVALFEQDVPAFENVARLEQLPVRGFTVIALPAKIGGGSGGPLRIVALIDP